MWLKAVAVAETSLTWRSFQKSFIPIFRGHVIASFVKAIGPYASDKNGKLSLAINNKRDVEKYRQGSRIADFLVCRNCGVMTGVCFEQDGCVYGSINIRSSVEYGMFGDSKEIRLTQLSDEERIKRWKENWFSWVVIENQNA
jgi:hypothetical protein